MSIAPGRQGQVCHFACSCFVCLPVAITESPREEGHLPSDLPKTTSCSRGCLTTLRSQPQRKSHLCVSQWRKTESKRIPLKWLRLYLWHQEQQSSSQQIIFIGIPGAVLLQNSATPAVYEQGWSEQGSDLLLH